eukprot:1718593-Karenia_brevis.AAC.1
MSFAPIIQEVEDRIDNSQYQIRIRPAVSHTVCAPRYVDYDQGNGRSTTAFVDDLAIIAHVHTSWDLYAGVNSVYGALGTATAKRGLTLNMKKRKTE